MDGVLDRMTYLWFQIKLLGHEDVGKDVNLVYLTTSF